MSDSATGLNWQTIVDSLMETFVTPEVRRRQAEGTLPRPLALRAAQIVFFPDGRPHVVRINDEVRVHLNVRLRDGVVKQAGEPILESEVEGLDGIALLPEEADCGHATLIRLRDAWGVAFDFTYNKALAGRHVALAQDFLDTARESFEQGRVSVSVDALFSAASLASKALFLSLPDPRFAKKTNHKAIHSRVNRWAHAGSLPEAHRDAFNRLSAARPGARYLEADVQLSERDCRELLDVVAEMIERARQQLAPAARGLDAQAGRG